MRSIVSNGPMNDQRRPRPCAITASRSSGSMTPSATRLHRLVDAAGLQPVHDEALDLALDATGTWPHSAISARRAGDAAADVAGPGDEFDDRHQVRRVGGMRDQATRARARPVEDAAPGQRRGRAADHRLGRRGGLDAAMDVALDRERPRARSPARRRRRRRRPRASARRRRAHAAWRRRRSGPSAAIAGSVSSSQASARGTASGSASHSRTARPPRAKMTAQPRPIRPAPTQATVSVTSGPARRRTRSAPGR